MDLTLREDIASIVDLSKLGVPLAAKPVLFGGIAMEHYGLRRHGHDIDLFVSFEDYEALAARYPEGRKDSWGDLGVVAGEFEAWRSIWKLDYSFFVQDAVECERYYVLSIEKLLFTKVLAMHTSEKQRTDVELVVKFIREKHQNPEIVQFMNAHAQSYLASEDGFVYGGKY